MCPQLVDFDADGRMDLVMGTFEGTAFVVPGSLEGFLPFRRITDRHGKNVQLSQFWNREQERWDARDRSPAGRTNPADHMISVAAVDWDGDGDLDLLLGAKEGRLYVERNEGTRTEPSYAGFAEPILTRAADGTDPNVTQVREGEHLTVPGGCTAPRVVDWNGDGLFDLLCGSFEGGVFLYLNRGNRSAPAFGAPIALVHNRVDRRGDDGGPMRGSYADAVDYDGDGDLDLVVGGYREVAPEPRELTPEEEARAAQLEAAIQAVYAELEAYFEDAEMDEDGDMTEAAMEGYMAILERLWPLQEELEELRPTPKELGRVYFYERLERR